MLPGGQNYVIVRSLVVTYKQKNRQTNTLPMPMTHCSIAECDKSPTEHRCWKCMTCISCRYQRKYTSKRGRRSSEQLHHLELRRGTRILLQLNAS